jgi:hypothetical protein
MAGIFKKLNWKTQDPIYVLGAPPSFATALAELAGQATIKTRLGKNVTFAIGFATRQSQVDKLAAQLAAASTGDATLWVAYPKASSKNYNCDFNRDTGWQRFGDFGFEPVRQVAIDEDWSALRFRRVEFIAKMTRTFAMTEAGKIKAARPQPGA